MGQREDNKLSDAVTNNTWSSLDLTDFPAEELRPLYRVIFRTAAGYANTPKAYIAQVDDFRFSEIIPTGGLATASNAYSSIQIFGGSTISADSANDTLILNFDNKFVISTNDSSDTINISIPDVVTQDTVENLSNKTLNNSGFGGGSSQGNRSGSYTIDYNNGVSQEVTLTGNLTLEGISNFSGGKFLNWVVKQDSTGGRTLSMGSGFIIDVKWKNNDYTLSTAANKIDVIKFFYSNGKVYGELLKDYY
jgi:hypothetical protein